MRNVTGFTLIELMIVIAILDILLALAIPAYRDYVIRAKVAEGLNLSTMAKTAVTLSRLESGRWPGNNQAAGLDSNISSHYVSAVDVQTDGVIRVSMQNITPSVNGRTLVLIPATIGRSAVDWSCRPDPANPVPGRYLPASCR